MSHLALSERVRWRLNALAAPAGEVAAEIIDSRVWARSDDVALKAWPEAWPTAFCLQAARMGVALDVKERTNETWKRGAEANIDLATGWWGGA